MKEEYPRCQLRVVTRTVEGGEIFATISCELPPCRESRVMVNLGKEGMDWVRRDRLSQNNQILPVYCPRRPSQAPQVTISIKVP
jgi:hypothetical protein